MLIGWVIASCELNPYLELFKVFCDPVFVIELMMLINRIIHAS